MAMSESEFLPTKTKILIVGAGPAGLATAISLVKHGLSPQDITVVDSILKGENSSRATVIHAGTLEALESIDCVSEILHTGLRGNGEHFLDRKGSPILTTSFGVLSAYTKYPFFIAISQAITERILLNHAESLGIVVHRPYRVIRMTPSSGTGKRGLSVELENGEVINARYVIGADGAKSVIRSSAGINFHDPDGRSADEFVDKHIAQMIMADVTFSPPNPHRIPPDLLALTPTDKGLFLTLPLDHDTAKLYTSTNELGEPVYRIGFTVPLEKGAAPSQANAKLIEEYINHQGPFHLSSDESVNPDTGTSGCVHVKKVHWSSSFKLRSAIADTFFKRVGDDTGSGGLVFLVGDAAHIHPPSGGQGMNLGIRDSIGLGKVLAEHVKRIDSHSAAFHTTNTKLDNTDLDQILGTSSLEAYAASRRAGALEVINLTKVLIKAATGVMTNKLVAWGLSVVSKLPVVQRQAVWSLSGLGDKLVKELKEGSSKGGKDDTEADH